MAFTPPECIPYTALANAQTAVVAQTQGVESRGVVTQGMLAPGAYFSPVFAPADLAGATLNAPTAAVQPTSTAGSEFQTAPASSGQQSSPAPPDAFTRMPIQAVAQVVLVSSDVEANVDIMSCLDQTGHMLSAVSPPELRVDWWVTWEGNWARHMIARCSQPALVVIAGCDGRRAVETARLLKSDVSRLPTPPLFIALVNEELATALATARTMAAIAAVDTWGYVTSGCFDDVVSSPINSQVASALVYSKLWPRAFPTQRPAGAIGNPAQTHAGIGIETINLTSSLGAVAPAAAAPVHDIQPLQYVGPTPRNFSYQQAMPQHQQQQPYRAQHYPTFVDSTSFRNKRSNEGSRRKKEATSSSTGSERKKRRSNDEVPTAPKGPFALPKRLIGRMLLFWEVKTEPPPNFKVKLVDADLAKLLGYDDPRDLIGADFVEDVVLHIGTEGAGERGRDKKFVVELLQGKSRHDVCMCLATKSGKASLPFNFRVRWLKNSASSKTFVVVAQFVLCSEEAAIFKHRQHWTLKQSPPPDTFEPPKVNRVSQDEKKSSFSDGEDEITDIDFIQCEHPSEKVFPKSMPNEREFELTQTAAEDIDATFALPFAKSPALIHSISTSAIPIFEEELDAASQKKEG